MKSFIVSCFLVILALFLAACSIPPARIQWQNEPGKIQKINCNPQSPVCKIY